MNNDSKMVASSSQSISSQIDLDVKVIEAIISNIANKNNIEEIRYLSYAFTNKVILVRLKNEAFEKVVLKVCVKEDRVPKLKLETELISRLSKETNLPVPHIIFKDLSPKNLTYPFVIYSFLKGENLADAIVHITNKEKLGEQLALIASELHKISFDIPHLSLAVQEGNQTWIDIVKDICNVGIKQLKVNNFQRVNAIEDYVNKNFPLVKEPKSYKLIHRDIQPQNIHWDNDLQEITGIFDFESAMSGDYHFEFNFLERRLFKQYPEIRKSFYKAYATYSELDSNFEQLVKFYEVVRDLYFYNRDLFYRELDRANSDIESLERLILNDWNEG